MLETARFFGPQRIFKLNLLPLGSKIGMFILKNGDFWLLQNLQSGNMGLQSYMVTTVWIGLVVPLKQSMCLFIYIICQALRVFEYVIHDIYSALMFPGFLLLA